MADGVEAASYTGRSSDAGMIDSGTNITPTRNARWARRLLLCISTLVVLGLVIRLTIKDYIVGLSTVYYATPLGLLALGSLACACLCYCLKENRIRTRAWLILFAIVGVWWNQSLWYKHAIDEQLVKEPGTIKLLFWNVARKPNLAPAANYIRKIDADIVGVVEVVGSGPYWKAFWQKQLPEYDVTILGGGMYLLTKGTSGETIPHALTMDSHCRELTITLGKQTLTCIVADIESSIYKLRDIPLTKLKDVMDTPRQHPLIVMGDFNTPTDSLYLKSYRENFRSLFEEVGNGYAATWPVFLPVLTLDQIWVDQRVQPVSCEHGFSTASDHRPVIATIRLKD